MNQIEVVSDEKQLKVGDRQMSVLISRVINGYVLTLENKEQVIFPTLKDVFDHIDQYFDPKTYPKEQMQVPRGRGLIRPA